MKFQLKHGLSPRILLSVLIALALIIMLVYLTNRNVNQKEAEDSEELAGLPVELDEFGIEDGVYSIKANVVGSRQTLSHLLSVFNVSAADIDGIARDMKEVFDPRRIRAGQSYFGYYEPDSVAALRYFVYEISNLEYLKICFKDSLEILREEKEVTIVPKTAAGIITSSLWNTLANNGLNPDLAIKLSEVLAWEVDFYRIQQGDRFKVVYEENYVGERSVGISRVNAVYFVHQGREVLGFHFEQDTIDGFFNHNGESLRKVFLKAPLEFGRISSRYSQSRMHPVLKYRRPHYGTDYAAPHGTPILSVGDGVVTQATYNSGNGNFVRIRHNSVYETQYLHMSRFASGVRPGTRVKQGQVIGYVGSTGLATGPHVCFRFWKNGQQVDHLREEFPRADNLPSDYLPSFYTVRDGHLETMNNIWFEEGQPV